MRDTSPYIPYITHLFLMKGSTRTEYTFSVISFEMLDTVLYLISFYSVKSDRPFVGINWAALHAGRVEAEAKKWKGQYWQW